MFSKKFLLFSLIILIGIFSIGFAAFAQDDYGLSKTAGAAELTKYGKDLPAIIGNVIGTALSLIAVIFFALMLYGGFMWMTARGAEEEAKKALNTIFAAIIGLLIVLAAYAITTFVFKSVSGGGTTTQITDNSKCTAKGEGYDCRDKSKEECDDATIQTGLCPDGTNIVCCKVKSQ